MSSRVASWLIAILLLGLFTDASSASAQSRRARRKPARQSAPAAPEPAADSGNELQDLDSESKPAPEQSSAATSEAEHSSNEHTPAEAAAPEDASNEAPAPGPSEAETPAAPSGPDLSVEPFIGMGVGTHSFRRPTKLGGQSMPDEPMPVVDVGMGFQAWPKRAFSWTFLLRYQTSVGFRVQEDPVFGLPNRVSVRADRLELSAAPTFRFGDSPTAAQLAFPIGASVRGFWPEVHNLLTPRYVMLGPFVRPELQLSLTDSLTLRIGPEFEWILLFSKHLTNNGVKRQGIALGGEAGLRLALGSIFALDLSYRQSTAMADVNYGPTFRDVERFLTLRLLGTM
jgi:hypothetical protein